MILYTQANVHTYACVCVCVWLCVCEQSVKCQWFQSLNIKTNMKLLLVRKGTQL
jgi:hypothetical protein